MLAEYIVLNDINLEHPGVFLPIVFLHYTVKKQKRPSGARKGKARKSRQVTTDTAGKFGCQ
jgi:hypothetical protein